MRLEKRRRHQSDRFFSVLEIPYLFIILSKLCVSIVKMYFKRRYHTIIGAVFALYDNYGHHEGIASPPCVYWMIARTTTQFSLLSLYISSYLSISISLSVCVVCVCFSLSLRLSKRSLETISPPHTSPTSEMGLATVAGTSPCAQPLD